MRWLFAMLIALFCWTYSVSGHQPYAAQTAATLATLNTQASANKLTISPNDHVYRPASELRRKSAGKLLLLLPRCHSYLGSILASAQLVPAYTLATEFGYRPHPQRSANTPALNRLQQINWVLHSHQQQSRLGGWKESNILYRGSLTYHS